MNLRLYELTRTLVNMILSLITFFLVMRIVLRFFSSNPQTPFVEWVFAVSSFLMTPFANIVPNITTGRGVFDVVAAITLLAYLIAGYVVLSLIEGVTRAELVDEEDSVVHYHDIPYKRKHKYPHRKEEYDL